MAFIVANRVKETTTATGTGAFALSGAVAGFVAFSAKMAIGDTCYAAREAVDSSGAPSGQWETGLYTCTAANQLTLTTLDESSTGAPVSFSAGTQNVYMTVPAVQAKWMREKLTANRTYYVRTDGSNSNTGLANTAGGAFLTLQKAADAIAALDLNGFAVTVQVADGTYTAGVTLPHYVGGGSVAFVGNTATPANVIISATSNHCFNAVVPRAFTINGFKLQTTTSGCGLVAAGGASIVHSNLNFGACATMQVQANSGGVITAATGYTISGSSPFHIAFVEGGVVSVVGFTVTLTGTPAFTAFVFGRNPSSLGFNACTFVGTATGSRYNLQNGASIYVNGAATTYLPGNAAGTLGSAGALGLYG